MASTRPCLNKREGLAARQKRKQPDDLTQNRDRLVRLFLSGSAGRIRTYDQVVNSHPLCQLSYRGIDKYINEKSGKNQIRPSRQRPCAPTFFAPQQRIISPRNTL